MFRARVPKGENNFENCPDHSPADPLVVKIPTINEANLSPKTGNAAQEVPAILRELSVVSGPGCRSALAYGHERLRWLRYRVE